ncbi:MAG: hypothetical protein FOGNACKC_01778 [Anaerolineae bacterium]|nr:hypothetical protein [Anaerolineae bacterium]
MKTLLRILFGVVLGALVGGIIGFVVGEYAVDLFEVSCFEGACGYLVAFIYIPAGGLLGAIGGGVLLYKRLGANSRAGRWLYFLAGGGLGLLAARLVLEISTRVLVWFLNMSSPSLPVADAILFAYNYIFSYAVVLAGVILGGWFVYKLIAAHRQPAAQ